MSVIDEGVAAPGFELPALVDGDHRRVALEDYLGDDVVILAFYPGDFNPACDEESDLDELDLFTMQKDVTVLAIGPDTLYAHAAFADAYALQIPLLSDTRRTVAERYDLTFDGDAGQELVERAVFVVDHDGEIAYAWSTRDLEALPVTEQIKDAIGETGGDETAFARFRVGHAHYVEGRRAFTSAMDSYADSEWMLAQSDFQRAREEFTEADEHFDSAVRFVDDELFEDHYLAAEEKATLLWQAADWLAQSASHYSSGRGAEGQRLRDDAERPLEEARVIAEPIDPDEWPPTDPPERTEPDDTEAFVPESATDEEDATLQIDVDEESAGEDADRPTDSADAADDIDDEELAEIEAELAGAAADDPVGEPPAERRSVIDHAPAADDLDGDPSDDRPNGARDDDRPSGARDDDRPSGARDDDRPSGAPDDDRTNGADDGIDGAGDITDDDLAELGAEIAASDPSGGVDEHGIDGRESDESREREEPDENREPGSGEEPDENREPGENDTPPDRDPDERPK